MTFHSGRCAHCSEKSLPVHFPPKLLSWNIEFSRDSHRYDSCSSISTTKTWFVGCGSSQNRPSKTRQPPPFYTVLPFTGYNLGDCYWLENCFINWCHWELHSTRSAHSLTRITFSINPYHIWYSQNKTRKTSKTKQNDIGAGSKRTDYCFKR